MKRIYESKIEDCDTDIFIKNMPTTKQWSVLANNLKNDIGLQLINSIDSIFCKMNTYMFNDNTLYLAHDNTLGNYIRSKDDKNLDAVRDLACKLFDLNKRDN